MTTPRGKPQKLAHPAIDHVEEIVRERAAILAILADKRKPSQVAPTTAPVATANPTRKEGPRLTRQLDDYSLFEKSDGSTWGVCGLRLSTDILTFPNREEATASGTALSRAARVSLWYEPTSHRRDGVLVISFRDEKR
jgi:hypothetical protein